LVLQHFLLQKCDQPGFWGVCFLHANAFIHVHAHLAGNTPCVTPARWAVVTKHVL